MSDIFCKKCGEPWDAYGARHGDMQPTEYQKFMHGQGCPACEFGTVCLTCYGAGVEPGELHDCPVCFGKRRVWARRVVGRRNWETGYTPRVVPCGPAYSATEHHHYKDAETDEGWSRCPACWNDTPVCPTCNGDGRYRTPEEAAALHVAYLESLIDGTDEDIIQYLEA